MTSNTVHIFQGTSDKGNIEEAIQNAVSEALTSLPTNLIRWTLRRVSGEYGGFVNAKLITVEIEVTV